MNVKVLQAIYLNLISMHLPNFHNISYLKNGSPVQQNLYRILTSEKVFEKLNAFNPVLIGTFPLDIPTPESDVDIACHVVDVESFRKIMFSCFGQREAYCFKGEMIRKKVIRIATFKLEGIPFEVYGENAPVPDQWGYQHMMIEFELLRRFGEPLRSEVLRLKRKGWTTEAAFVEVLGLDGHDPYRTLLNLKLTV